MIKENGNLMFLSQQLNGALAFTLIFIFGYSFIFFMVLFSFLCFHFLQTFYDFIIVIYSSFLFSFPFFWLKYCFDREFSSFTDYLSCLVADRDGYISEYSKN